MICPPGKSMITKRKQKKIELVARPGLLAAANIFSNLKLVYIFSVNPYLGPLQVTLSRMVIDILKFVSLFFLVLFSFSCGEYQPDTRQALLQIM